MIKRLLLTKLNELLQKRAAVVLLGPRQVGKTTLALEVAKQQPSEYLDLENSTDLLKVENIRAYQEENRNKLLILDEIQQTPELFKELRGIIDQEKREGNRSGLFLLLGSASTVLLKQTSESLAGRVSYQELYPVNVLEFGKETETVNQLWLRGGFPESLLAENESDSIDWRTDFIKTYLERDIPQFGFSIPATTLERLWTMIAHQQGGLLNSAQLARNIEVSNTSIHRYIDLLEELFLIRRLPPYHINIKKRLIKSPKVYVRDSGLVHALLGISSFNQLLGHPVIGGSWEGFVIENLLSVASKTCKPYFYRSSGGAEIDLVLDFGGNQIWAIEIKRNVASKTSRGFYSACEDIKPSRKFLLHSGQDSFPLKNEVRAVSLPDLMGEIQSIG